MRFVAAFIAAALLGSAPIGSASAQPQLTGFRVALLNLEPLESTGRGQRFRAALLIDNMNTEALKIRNIEFKLSLADQGIVDGNTGGFTIEALDQQTLTLELSSEIVSSVSRLLSFVQGPENKLPYEIFGKVTLDRRNMQPLTFSAHGLVPLVMPAER
jgi:LEA14-like dessication related protein